MRKYKIHNYFVLVLIIGIVFIAGILFGKSIESKDMADVSRFINDLELNTESFVVEQELLGTIDTDCSLAKSRIDDLSSELYELGLRLNDPNAKVELGEDSFNLMKRKFHLMQIRTYMLLIKLKNKCETDDQIILFYYGKDDPESEEQGKVLDEIGKRFNIKVFAIEFQYSKELSFLEKSYNITQTPSVVINYDKVMQGFSSYADIVNTIV